MIKQENHESQIWKLLQHSGLADLSQFHRRGFFDEVPLFSRESDLEFLSTAGGQADLILLRFALKFLRSVISYDRHRSGFFAAITLWDLSDTPVVPNLFVWCDAPRGLEKKLALKPATTPFGKRIERLIPRLRLSDPFEMLEDESTLPGTARVFIAPACPPYEGCLTLANLRRPPSIDD